MKTERFIREYASWKMKHYVGDGKAEYQKNILRVIILREKGMITVDEAIKCISEEN